MMEQHHGIVLLPVMVLLLLIELFSALLSNR
jgi:hypothetical protein